MFFPVTYRAYMFCVMFCTLCVFISNKSPALGEIKNGIKFYYEELAVSRFIGHLEMSYFATLSFWTHLFKTSEIVIKR